MKKKALVILAAASISAAIYSTPSQPRLTHADQSSKNELDVDYVQVIAQQFSPVTFHNLRAGGTVDIRISPTFALKGTINTVQGDETIQLGGDLDNNAGTFVYGIDSKGTVCGMVMLINGDVYELEPTPRGSNGVYFKRKAHTVVCSGYPGDLEESGAAVEVNTTAAGVIGRVPLLASRPTAKVQLYIDFDGETVLDPSWNGGKIIKAAAAPYKESQIREIWSLVAERFSAFDINVTTRRDNYDKAPAKQRMRVIVTPTNEWRPNFGGIAFIGSMQRAGTGATSATIPAFVFTKMFGRTKSLAESIAHEAGHTMGLNHDGARGKSYYTGHGNWAPIMGTSYNSTISQWSKGEYAGANNTQDDIAAIASVAGFASSGSVSIGTLGSVVNDRFVLCNERDSKTYRVNLLKGGTINITANPGAWSAVDVKIDVIASNGVVASSNVQNSQSAIVRHDASPGVYQVRITPSSDGNPLTTGYSAYGSIGTVVITGSIQSK